MQKALNKVGKNIIKVNSDDMKEELKKVQCSRTAGPGVINVALNTRYNSTWTENYNKPRTSSSQAVTLACETMTKTSLFLGLPFKQTLFNWNVLKIKRL